MGMARLKPCRRGDRRMKHLGGWGQRFAFWMLDDDPKPYGSWGNGGAMRVAPVAWLADNL